MPPLPVSDQGGAAPELASRCASCTAPLAADQLFCLACGARRRDARIPFRDVLATEAAPVIAPMAGGPGGPAGPSGPALGGWASAGPSPAASPVTLLAMAVCLLLALGLGVWIGRGQEAPIAAGVAPVAAAPIAAVAATTPADDATVADDAAADDTKADRKKASSDDADAAAADEPAEAAPEPPAAAKALENLSAKDYQKQAQKLPSEVGTGGEAPPTDDKAAGGGSEFEDFQ